MSHYLYLDLVDGVKGGYKETQPRTKKPPKFEQFRGICLQEVVRSR